MGYKVAVAGCTGYVGGELLRLLLAHPEVEIGALTAGESAGKALGEFHPNLIALLDRTVEATSAATLAAHDVVFLALPHGASGAIAAELPHTTLVLDCGADHRLSAAAAWEQFYGTPYAGHWPYGMPELPGQRDVLKTTKRIAVPGCYVTTVTLSLMPALRAGLIDGHDIVVAAASGTSGAGKAPKTQLLASEIAGSMGAYGVGGTHRHIPEILQNLTAIGAKQPTLSFTPMLAPMSRGILAVCTAPVAPSVTDAEVRDAYHAGYDSEPFAHLCAPGVWPNSKWVQGSNGFLVQATVDVAAGRLVAVGVLDNLTKGTAGQAIQAMNLALGLPETTGLSTIGVTP
ncbi:MAG: N-acetyl-gamma-glutamyl-phosphate reductase [Propionibacteriaceae bacterium]|jgi:N-acetyl-gamma-glutamyl-phosphate reductase|nr:N-acetyl-gamma-glutamyl-phosphate reductase [Propionibacteriaceae bacterium]